MFVNKKCQNDIVSNYSNCDCEYKKAIKLTVEKECEKMIDDISQSKTNCKPFVASSILFVTVSIILTGIMIYFHCK